MARKKAKNSKGSLMNLGLKPEEDAELLKTIEKNGHELSVRQLVRALLRQWIKEGGKSVLASTK